MKFPPLDLQANENKLSIKIIIMYYYINADIVVVCKLWLSYHFCKFTLQYKKNIKFLPSIFFSTSLMQNIK